MPTVSLFVFYDGRVFPCCHPHVHTKMPMGDLTKQSFKEIWNGRNYRNLRAGLTRGEAPPLCERCSIIHSPPTVYEDPAVLDDEGADLATWYAGRDLEPLEDGLPTLDLVAKATRAEIADHLVKSRAHVEAIENDRRGLRGHAEALESERRDLRAHVGALESERRDLRAHVEAIGSERRGLRAHSETLERDRRGLRAHSETLERDRRGLRAHAETLERDRRGLRAHVEALESERETMRSHIESLERILTRIHGIPIYRALCRVKDCILPRGKGSRQAD